MYHRQREDKLEPNFQEVAMNTWRSILASVDQEELKAVTADLPDMSVPETGKGEKRPRTYQSDEDGDEVQPNKRRN